MATDASMDKLATGWSSRRTNGSVSRPKRTCTPLNPATPASTQSSEVARTQPEPTRPKTLIRAVTAP